MTNETIKQCEEELEDVRQMLTMVVAMINLGKVDVALNVTKDPQLHDIIHRCVEETEFKITLSARFEDTVVRKVAIFSTLEDGTKVVTFEPYYVN